MKPSAGGGYGLDLVNFLKLIVMMTLQSASRAGSATASYSTEVDVY